MVHHWPIVSPEPLRTDHPCLFPVLVLSAAALLSSCALARPWAEADRPGWSGWAVYAVGRWWRAHLAAQRFKSCFQARPPRWLRWAGGWSSLSCFLSCVAYCTVC